MFVRFIERSNHKSGAYIIMSWYIGFYFNSEPYVYALAEIPICIHIFLYSIVVLSAYVFLEFAVRTTRTTLYVHFSWPLH